MTPPTGSVRRPHVITGRAGAVLGACMLGCLWISAYAQVSDTGTGVAGVAATMSATVPGVADLRLDASELVFDLAADAFGSEELACVYGFGPDVVTGLAPVLGHQAPVLPLGTGFRQVGHPVVRVEGRAHVHAYPASPAGGTEEAPVRSDENFVCYRSFLLHRFTNVGGWHLTVERPHGGLTEASEALYVRDGGCADDAEVQGLFPLHAGERLVLASAATSAPCPEGDVVVLAVKTGVLRAGESRAHLIYTLMASAFESTPLETP